MRHMLSLFLAVSSSLALAETNTCNFKSTDGLLEKFRNKSFDGYFQSGTTVVKTVVTFKGEKGNFKRQGAGTPNDLLCVRYLSVEEAEFLAGDTDNEALAISNYVSDTSVCAGVIIADWVVGASRGRVLWCAPAHAPGAEIKGVYWQDKETDWSNTKFTGIWEGRWQ